MSQTRGLILDTACPVNWAHPLNRGLAGMWANWPNSGWTGGLTLRDAAGLSGKKRYPGTLTGGPTRAGTAPDGFKSLSLGGSSYVNMPAIFQGQDTFTAGCWFRTTTGTANETLIAGGKAGATDSWIRLCITNTGVLRINIGANDTTQASFDGPTVTANKLQYAAMAVQHTGSGFNARIQLDGAVSTSTIVDAAFNPFTYFALGVLRFSSDLQFLTGNIGSAFVSKAYFSPGEMKARYLESKRGYPNTLNWLRPWSFGAEVAAGGGGFQAAWARCRNVLIQPLVSA